MNSNQFFVLALLCISLIAFVVCTDPTPSVPRRSRDDLKFSNFKIRFDKQYRDANEETYRKNIFLQNLAVIDSLNNDDVASAEAEFGITEYSDLTVEEFNNRFLMVNDEISYPDPPADSVREARAQVPRNTEAAPASFDWRNRKALTPVKNQLSCGSCWAFTVTEEIETQNFLSGKNLSVLSPQQIVDCDTSNWGCGGGWPATAYAYIIKAGGLQTATTYPYTGRGGSCKFTKSKAVQTIKSWAFSSKAAALNEAQMLQDLWTYGPLSVCLSAANFGYYSGGVFTGPSGSAIDHCVQLVGYGTTSTGVKYWTIKNQWGASWGENGYMRIRRDVNQNLIAAYATRVIV